MRCLPADSLIFLVPSSFLCVIVSLLLPRPHCPLPPATRPPQLPCSLKHIWYCWTEAFQSRFPQASRTPGTTPGTGQCVCSVSDPTPDAWDHLQVCALPVQPLSISMMPHARHEISGVWNMQIFHEIISARSSSLPGSYMPEYFPEKFKSSVEKEYGNAEILSSTSGSATEWYGQCQVASACCLSLQVCSWMAPPAAVELQHADLQVPSFRNVRRIEPWSEFMDAWHDNGNRIKFLSCSRWTQERRRKETKSAHECVVKPEVSALDEEGSVFALFICVWLCLSSNWVIGMSFLKSRLNERQQPQKECVQRLEEEDEEGRGWVCQCSVERSEKMLLFV